MSESLATARPRKPLGRKAYGSIPHLPGSRMGPADHSCHIGQRDICWGKARDRHDRIIVTEKVDGSCMSIANVSGEILAIGRSGYLASTSPFRQHHLFAKWVEMNEGRFRDMLAPGDRLVGEWIVQAHGTVYHLHHEPFIAFDLFHGLGRAPFDEFQTACEQSGVVQAAVLHDGAPIHLDAVLPLIEVSAHGAQGPVEGAVWRVERRGTFDFIAKWVRPDKQDGVLLSAISGREDVWNEWNPVERELLESLTP